ncbi:MAG: DNA primase [Caldilinea sp.]|nr:DNA primase [Caldilinea sp.]MDW8440231.1 DNA primase [Caldilineaceae bacterium]
MASSVTDFNVTDTIKQRVDLVELVSRYTSLKRAGSVYKGLCPFHSERTPSFVVFPHTGTWHCFGACGVGGDVFSFVMRKENLTFREALELLAAQVGVDLKVSGSEARSEQRTLLYEVNELAAGFFQHALAHHPMGEKARLYLKSRGVDETTAQAFRLGYALPGWSGLRDHLLEHGVSLELLLDAGLVKRNEERQSTYDAFRDRLIFPICDRQGRVIGFGGRAFENGAPKYLNTSETPIFHKSHVVYGLDRAHRAIREQNRVIIVEGYMDVIAAHQHGYTNIVACMGTALTSEQLQQLQRYTNNFVLALDADAAGQQATVRGLNQARQSLARVSKPVVTPDGKVQLQERLGANLFITTLPEGRDPDEVIRQDARLWEQLVAEAKPLVDFYFDVVARQADLSTALGKGQAVAELTPLIAELHDEIEQQHYIQRLSRMVQIDETIIASRVQASARTMRALAGNQRPGPAQNANPMQTSPAPSSSERRAAKPGPYDTEDHVLAHLLADVEIVLWLAQVTEQYHLAPVQPQDWRHVENQEIFRALKRFLNSDEPWDIELFQDTLDPQLHGRFAQLLAYAAMLPAREPNLVREDVVKGLLRMRIDRLRAETKRIKYLQDELQQNGDLEGVRSFEAVMNGYLRELAHLQRQHARIPQELFRRTGQREGAKLVTM